MFKGSSKLGLWGVIATIIYFLAIAYLIFYTDYVEPKALTLNELGDFFAGVFGPPALIWVVISFYLQSEELKNSVSALNLQAEELRKSVEQQIAMVELTRESISHEKGKHVSEENARRANMQPNFLVELVPPSKTVPSSRTYFELRILNTGGLADKVVFAFSTAFRKYCKSPLAAVWERSDCSTIEMSIESSLIGKIGPEIHI